MLHWLFLSRCCFFWGALGRPEISSDRKVTGNLFERTYRDGDRLLEFSVVNEEFLVNASPSARIDCVPALCTHRPSLLPIECLSECSGPDCCARVSGYSRVACWEVGANLVAFRGSKSRNKVSVGEPAEGSLTRFPSLSRETRYPRKTCTCA